MNSKYLFNGRTIDFGASQGFVLPQSLVLFLIDYKNFTLSGPTYILLNIKITWSNENETVLLYYGWIYRKTN